MTKGQEGVASCHVYDCCDDDFERIVVECKCGVLSQDLKEFVISVQKKEVSVFSHASMS